MSWLTKSSFTESRLALVSGINLRSTAKQTLYIVPGGRSCVITRVVIRNASAAITAATGTFGFNAAADDVIAVLDLTSLANSTFYATGYPVATGAVMGSGGDVLGFRTVAQEATADLVTMDVFGYLI